MTCGPGLGSCVPCKSQIGGDVISGGGLRGGLVKSQRFFSKSFNSLIRRMPGMLTLNLTDPMIQDLLTSLGDSREASAGSSSLIAALASNDHGRGSVNFRECKLRDRLLSVI